MSGSCFRSSSHHGRRANGALVMMVLNKGNLEEFFLTFTIRIVGCAEAIRCSPTVFYGNVVVVVKKKKKKRKGERNLSRHFELKSCLFHGRVCTYCQFSPPITLLLPCSVHHCQKVTSHVPWNPDSIWQGGAFRASIQHCSHVLGERAGRQGERKARDSGWWTRHCARGPFRPRLLPLATFLASNRPVGRRRRAPTVRLGAIAVHTCRSRFVLPFSRFPNSIHSLHRSDPTPQAKPKLVIPPHPSANPTTQPPSIIPKPIFPSASDRPARLCNPGNA